MTLSDSIKTDVTAIFLNTDEFAETVVYYFADGGSRSIPAIVDRDPPAIYDAGNVVMPSYVITIANSCTNGVTKAELDTGGDEVELFAEFCGVVRTRVTVLQEVERDYGGAIGLALK